MGPIPFATLVSQADLIVQGQVQSVALLAEPALPQGSEGVPSYVAEVVVSRVVKGAASMRRVSIEYRPSSESASYEPGERAVLFLKRGANREIYTTVGQLQGKYQVRGGMVERDGVGVSEFLHRIEAVMRKPGR